MAMRCLIGAAVAAAGAGFFGVSAQPVQWDGGGGNGLWHTPLNWSNDAVPNSATVEVRIDADALSDTTVSLNLGATVGSLTIDAGDTLNLLNDHDLILADFGDAGLVNHGTLNLLATVNDTFLSINNTASITGSGQIVLGDDTQNRLVTNNTVITHGPGHTIRGGGQLLNNTGGMINQGTILADQATPLSLDPSGLGFVNQGVLRAQDGALLILLPGAYTNAGQTIEAANASRVDLTGGFTVTGGTLRGTGTGTLRVASPGVTLAGVTVEGRLDLPNDNDADITTSLTNNGTVELAATVNDTFIRFLGDQTLGGTGTLVLGNDTQNRLVTNNATLTHAPGHTLRGGGQLLNNTGGMINQGTILADQPTPLVIDPTSLGFVNQGTLRAEGAGGLVFLAGDFTNSNEVIEVGDGSRLDLNGGVVIHGGTLQAAGSGAVHVVTTGPVLDAVTLEAPLNQPNDMDVIIENGLINNSTITLAATVNDTFIRFNGDTTLGGTGSIVLGNDTQNRVLTNGAMLTHGADHTLRGAGQLLNNTGGLVNLGTILADQDTPLEIDPSSLSFTNQGTLRAQGTGGLVFLPGEFVNTGRTIEIADGSKLNINGSTNIRGGTLQATGSGAVNAVTTGALLDAVILEAPLNQPNDIDVIVVNGLTNNRTISLSAEVNDTFIRFDGDQTLGGTGTIVLGDDPRNRVITNGAMLTHAAGHTIRGAGNLLSNAGGMINQGTILADQPTPLVIDPSGLNFTNQGTLRTEGAGGLRFEAGLFVNTGRVIEIADGSKLDLVGGATVRNGTLQATGSGAVNAVSTGVTLDAVTLNAPLNQLNDIDVFVVNGLTNNNTISLSATVNDTFIRFDGDQTLGGTGTIVLGNDSQNRVITNGAMLTHAASHTIRGAGNLLSNAGGMINDGTILADQPTPLVIDPSGLNFTNQGTLRADGAGGLRFEAGLFINTGRVIEIADGSKLDLVGGATVRNGTLQATGSGAVHAVSSGVTLDAVTLEAPVNQLNDIDLEVANGLVNNDTLSLFATVNDTFIRFDGDQTLGGTGTIVLGDDAQNRVITNGSMLTHGPDHTIRGAGNLLSNAGGMINQGTILADQSTPLVIDASGLGFTNAPGGVLGGTGTIQFADAFSNDGVIAPGLSPGTLTIAGSVSNTATAELRLELGGDTAGTFDVLQVQGGYTAGGQLVASLVGFEPTGSESLVVLTADTLAGLFDNATGGLNPATDPLPDSLVVPNVRTDNAEFDVVYDFLAGTVTLANISVNTCDSTLVGDLNCDGFVGAGDLDILLGVWNQNVGGGVLADLNADGFIGAGDLDILLGNWNAGSPPATVVPEPATAVLLGLGGLLIAGRRRA